LAGVEGQQAVRFAIIAVTEDDRLDPEGTESGLGHTNYDAEVELPPSSS